MIVCSDSNLTDEELYRKYRFSDSPEMAHFAERFAELLEIISLSDKNSEELLATIADRDAEIENLHEAIDNLNREIEGLMERGE